MGWLRHTTLDIPALVPAWGMEAATRAFLKVIDWCQWDEHGPVEDRGRKTRDGQQMRD